MERTFHFNKFYELFKSLNYISCCFQFDLWYSMMFHTLVFWFIKKVQNNFFFSLFSHIWIPKPKTLSVYVVVVLLANYICHYFHFYLYFSMMFNTSVFWFIQKVWNNFFSPLIWRKEGDVNQMSSSFSPDLENPNC